jgi:hypothetical protein
MKTVDAGKTWARIDVPNVYANVFIADHGNISLPDDHTVIVGMGRRIVAVSVDDGKTWESRPIPDSMNDPNRIFLWSRFATALHGYALPLAGEIGETQDGGKTWAKSAAPGLPYFQDAKRGWATSGDSVIRTVDGGITWTDKVRVTGVSPDYVSAHGLTATTKRLFVVGGDEGHGISLVASRLLPGVTEDAAGAIAPVNAAPHAPIPVKFHLDQAGYVTLVVDDAAGKRVRNLISETFCQAGDNTVWWDGVDDVGRIQTKANYNFVIDGRLVNSGVYKVRGLVRPDIQLRYELTPYNPGQPPWPSADPSSDWLANHTPPSGVLFLPKSLSDRTSAPSATDGELLVCAAITEGGSGLAWLDLNGKKLMGQMWVGGVWTGASNLARDTGDNPVPGVYAYAGSAFDGSGYDGPKAELRLAELLTRDAVTTGPRDGRMGTGLDRPLLAPNAPYQGLLPAGATNLKTRDEDYRYTFPDAAHVGLSGLAVRNGVLIASLPKMNQLLFVDARLRKIVGPAALDDPRGIAFDSSGGLLALSGKRLVRFRSALRPTDVAAPQVLVATGLEDPQNLTLDMLGNIYVSDRGSSNQVKVFAADGRFLRIIGKPGLPKLGAYDPLLMHNPNGITIDSHNRVWVAETDYVPKRVSVWTTAGQFVKALYGPMEYGGGGAIDPNDKSRFYYNGLEFKLNWVTGESYPTSIYYLPETDKLNLLSEFKSRAPESAITYGGKQYLTDCYNVNPTNGARAASIWLLENHVARPVAAAGSTADWKNPAIPNQAGNTWFVWSDLNGDGLVQTSEVTFTPGVAGGVTVMPDLSFVLAYAGDNAIRLKPARVLASGVPIYTPVVPVVVAPGARAPRTSGGSQTLIGTDGWSVVTVPPAPYPAQAGMSGVHNGVPLWTYPSLWPGLHPSQDAPKPSHPGELIGTTRLLGGLFTPRGSDAGPMWAINGNKGNVYIFTQDGLFVATLFRDCRSSSWSASKAERGMSVNELSLQEEDFWPSITQTEDGAIYIVGGGSGGNIVSVTGLEKAKRLAPFDLPITPTAIVACRDYSIAQEASRKQAKTDTLTVAMRPSPPSVNGNLDDWPEKSFVTIDTDARAAVCVSGDKLFAAFRTSDPKLVVNAGKTPQLLFKTGGALDLMLDSAPGGIRLLVATVSGKPIAMLYRAKLATGAQPVPFSSPQRTVTFDRVEDVSDAVTLASSGGNYELSVSLVKLGLSPSDGLSLRGDIGVLRGNRFQTLDRSYWSNKAAGLTSDVPTEAELLPKLWGTWTFMASP